MPTYQYACTDGECGNRFELVQSFTDPSASECPVCAGSVRKVYGSVGVVFKGSGFYRTDSRAASSSSSESSAEGKKSENKTDTRPENKTDTRPEKKSESTSDSKSGSKSDSTSGSKPAASPAPAAASA